MNSKIYPKMRTPSLFTDNLYGCVGAFRVSVLTGYLDNDNDDLANLNFVYQCKNTYWRQIIPYIIIVEPQT